jgi:hypothetical protein
MPPPKAPQLFPVMRQLVKRTGWWPSSEAPPPYPVVLFPEITVFVQVRGKFPRKLKPPPILLEITQRLIVVAVFEQLNPPPDNAPEIQLSLMTKDVFSTRIAWPATVSRKSHPVTVSNAPP